MNFILSEFLIVTWVIAIVLVINSHIVTSNQRVIEPNELCQTDDECSNTGIKGHVSCVENICICDTDSIFITEYGGVKVCSLNAQLGFECNTNYDCAAKDSICLEEIIACNLTEKAKSCQCPVNHELRRNKCEKMTRRKLQSRCCDVKDCLTNFDCDFSDKFSFGLCKCEDIFIKDQCFKHNDTCNSRTKCDTGKFCEKINDNLGVCKAGDCKDNCFNNITECEEEYALYNNQCYNISHLGLEDVEGHLQISKINVSDQAFDANNPKYMTDQPISLRPTPSIDYSKFNKQEINSSKQNYIVNVIPFYCYINMARIIQ